MRTGGAVFALSHDVPKADLPDLDLNLTGTRVIDERLVLLDYRVASRR
jgi:hypothetical protein